MVEIHNLLLRNSTVDGILNSCRIIRPSVALGTSTSNTNEVGCGISFILRFRFGVNFITIEQTLRPLCWCKRTLEFSGFVGCVLIALAYLVLVLCSHK